MMKLVLLFLFFTLCSVQPSLRDKIVIPSSGNRLYYENSSSTFICKHTHAIWKVNKNSFTEKITECNCPGKCEDILVNKTRITAFCKGSSPVLHFKQMKLDDSDKVLECSSDRENKLELHLLVGRKNDDFYPKEPFALVNNNYTLVCERKMNQNVYFFDERDFIGGILTSNYIYDLDEKNFDITIDQLKIKFTIKKVALKDDRKMFGCYHKRSHLSILYLTVNVPVSSVALHQKTKGFLIEYKNAIFICKVDESKPKASFQWILSENGSEREITRNIDVTSKQNGKRRQTNSTLKLKLKRSFKAIKCRAKIQGMAWTNSTSLQLDVKYPPSGNPVITMNNPKIYVGKQIIITCEWRRGHPSASVNLTCLSQTKSNEDFVTITATVTREMRNHCRCEGLHVARNAFTTYDLSIQYAPEITISYENLEIHCSANACPANITYELVQKWGNIEKRRFYGNKMVFQNLTYQDSGEWICRASNGVPTKTKKRYSEKSVEVKVDVSAQFSGDETQQAISGHEKSIKVCFYCHPEAEAVEWHSEYGKISLIQSVSSPAEEGPFPFTGNCSSLTLDITETSAKNYELIVTNTIGKRNFSVNLDIKENDDNTLVIILVPTIAALFIIIISGGILYFKYRSYSKDKPIYLKMQQKDDE